MVADVGPSVVCCPSRGHISKTKQDRPILLCNAIRKLEPVILLLRFASKLCDHVILTSDFDLEVAPPATYAIGKRATPCLNFELNVNSHSSVTGPEDTRQNGRRDVDLVTLTYDLLTQFSGSGTWCKR